MSWGLALAIIYKRHWIDGDSIGCLLRRLNDKIDRASRFDVVSVFGSLPGACQKPT
jgi:hypothetical protein